MYSENYYTLCSGQSIPQYIMKSSVQLITNQATYITILRTQKEDSE